MVKGEFDETSKSFKILWKWLLCCGIWINKLWGIWIGLSLETLIGLPLSFRYCDVVSGSCTTEISEVLPA